MKQIFAFLFLLLIPNFVLALPDSCGNPKEFTVDKRCYVKETQKKAKPYNAVVGLLNDHDDIHCTGTIVKVNNKLYLYTAKHCTDVNDDYRPDSSFVIKTQNGITLSVKYNNSGNYDIENDEKLGGDWAIYNIFEKNLPNVDISNKLNIKFKIGDSDYGVPVSYDARLIGYGGLKVMSDKEIREFRNKYVEYLRDIEGLTGNVYQEKYGFTRGGIYAYKGKTGNPYVIDFLDYLKREERNYYLDLFEDIAFLKESKCEYHSSGLKENCQGWGGNSGGGIFDNNGNLMSINTRGNRIIGGNHHAGKEELSGESEQINLLESPGEKIDKGLQGLKDLFK